MEFSIIVASDLSGGIGNKGAMPWKLPKDMLFFKMITTGQINSVDQFDQIDGFDFENMMGNCNNPNYAINHDKIIKQVEIMNKPIKQNAIIMGRNTADGFKAPLKNRLNIIITSIENYRIDENFVSFADLNSALNWIKKETKIDDVFVIGGAKLYESAIVSKYCRRIFCTFIDATYECDTFISQAFMKNMCNMFESIKHVATPSCMNAIDNKEKGSDVTLTFAEYVYHNHQERAYLDLGKRIIESGDYRETRNAKTYSLFGEKLEFEVVENDDGTYTLPILTTKTIFTRGVIEELLFFMRGDTDTTKLTNKGVRIWESNTCQEFLDATGKTMLKRGEMGPMYGFIWRSFGATYMGGCHDYTGKGFDQLQDCIDKLATDPHSRRIVLTTYNPEQAEQGVLYPCHGLTTQFYVEGDSRISVQTYQRSADYFLGLPFNIMSYSLFLCIIVKLVNAKLETLGKIVRYKPGKMITVLGDVHIYSDENADHTASVLSQLKLYDRTYRFPHIRIDKEIRCLADIDESVFNASDIKVMEYVHHPKINADMVA